MQIIIAENDRGWVGLDGNELIVGSKLGDPPKLRLTSPVNADGGGGGVVSFCLSRHAGVACDGHDQVEMGFLRGEQSEAVRGQQGNPRCEFNILLNAGSEDDAAMQRAGAIECDRVTKPGPAFSGSGGGGAAPSRIVSPDGRWWLQLQNDGNYVIYDASNPAHPKAVYDLWWLLSVAQALGHPYPR